MLLTHLQYLIINKRFRNQNQFPLISIDNMMCECENQGTLDELCELTEMDTLDDLNKLKSQGYEKSTEDVSEVFKKMVDECENQGKISPLGEWEIYNPGEGMAIINSCADNTYYRKNTINDITKNMLSTCSNRIKLKDLDEKQSSFFRKFSNMANNVVNFIKSIVN